MSERKDRIRVHIAAQEFFVVGGSFQEMLAAVKQINGRRFIGPLKAWQLPGSVEDVRRQLDISGYILEGGQPIAASSPPSAAPTFGATDRIRIVVEGHELAVVGGGFQEMLAAVKGLPGRRFDSESKIWQIPGEVPVIKGIIQAAGFELEGSEDIPSSPVPPMEQPDFANQDQFAPPPPFEEPDFYDDDQVPEPPDWWDDAPEPVPFSDNSYGDEPVDFEAEPTSFWEDSAGPTPSIPHKSGNRDDRIRIRLGEVSLVITGGSFQQMLTTVKGIPGRRFNPGDKVWEFSDEIGLETIQQAVKAAGFEIRPAEM